jgi:hypothetical protein
MNDLKNKVILGLLVVVAFLFGNTATSFFKDTFIRKTPILSTDIQSEYLNKVSEEFAKIESKEDKLLIYKLFSGAAEYLDASTFSGNTSQFDPLLGKVQSSYGWKREKYSAFTDAVSAYLVSVGYDVPKQIVTIADRNAFSKIFKDLSKVLK